MSNDNHLPLILVRIKPHTNAPIDEQALANGVVVIDEQDRLLAVRSTLNALMGSLNAIPPRMNLEYKQDGGEVVVNFYLEGYSSPEQREKLFAYVASYMNAARIMSGPEARAFAN